MAAAPALAGAEVLDWQALAPEMVTLVKITDLAGALVLVLVFLAAAGGVANTMLMATFERTREFGMLLALGTHPARLVKLVVAESIALGLIGALAGSAIGIALVAVTHRTGIDYAMLAGGGPSELSFAGLRWSLRFYPTLDVIDVARTIAAVCVTSLVASVWPALRTSRLQPAGALRGIGLRLRVRAVGAVGPVSRVTSPLIGPFRAFSGRIARNSLWGATQYEKSAVMITEENLRVHAPGDTLHLPGGSVTILRFGATMAFNRWREQFTRLESDQ